MIGRLDTHPRRLALRPVALNPRPMSCGELFKHLSALVEPMLLRAGDRLFVAGEPADGIYVIHRGKVRIVSQVAGGTSVTERLVHGGDILGFGPLFANHVWEATGEVVTTTRAGFIRKDAVMQFLEEHPEGRLSILRILSQDVDRCYEMIRHRGFAISKIA